MVEIVKDSNSIDMVQCTNANLKNELNGIIWKYYNEKYRMQNQGIIQNEKQKWHLMKCRNEKIGRKKLQKVYELFEVVYTVYTYFGYI